jgi:hypothetical protein
LRRPLFSYVRNSFFFYYHRTRPVEIGPLEMDSDSNGIWARDRFYYEIRQQSRPFQNVLLALIQCEAECVGIPYVWSI